MSGAQDLREFVGDLQRLLDGKGLDKGEQYPLDVTSRKDDDYKVITKRSVCYIVCAVIIDDDGKILFMQEAKPSCRGKWYLPAGRMEPNETIVEGVKREVVEETGLEFEPQTLLCIEVGSCSWYRFVFAGKVTGGKLKSLSEKDEESLQAKWLSMDDLRADNKFPLRATDIVKLVMLGQHYRETPDVGRHPSLLPVISSHTKLIVRLFVVHQDGELFFTLLGMKGLVVHGVHNAMNISDHIFDVLHQEACEDLSVLTCTSPVPHIPSAVINPIIHRNLLYVFGIIFKDAFGGLSTPDIDVLGVLSLEHHGKPEAVNDGFAMTLLMLYPNMDSRPEIQDDAKEKYTWFKVEDDSLKTMLRTKLKKGQCVSLLPV